MKGAIFYGLSEGLRDAKARDFLTLDHIEISRRPTCPRGETGGVYGKKIQHGSRVDGARFQAVKRRQRYGQQQPISQLPGL